MNTLRPFVIMLILSVAFLSCLFVLMILLLPGDIEGKVVNAEGEPVAGIRVDMATERGELYVSRRVVVPGYELPTTTTDEQGRFEFSSLGSDYHMLALNEDGYAFIDADEFVAADHTITLIPLCTIKGRLLVGDKALAGEMVSLKSFVEYPPGKHFPRDDYSALTDEQGYFEFTSVPAGEGDIVRELQLPEDVWWCDAISEEFTIRPGETREINIGGTGRPVIGQYVAHEGVEANSFPVSFAVMRSSDGAMSQLDTRERHYEAIVDSDGRFRIENVRPGEYKIAFELYVPPSQTEENVAHRITYLRQSFSVEVPPLPDGLKYYDEPLDTGKHVVYLE